MRKVTRKSIKDSDINLGRVEKRLLEIAGAININNKKLIYFVITSNPFSATG